MTPHYRYIGTDDMLVGHTALGQTRDGRFLVQVDNFIHLWSHGWHETPRADWTEMSDDEEIVC
jgi:hypothetical protein